MNRTIAVTRAVKWVMEDLCGTGIKTADELDPASTRAGFANLASTITRCFAAIRFDREFLMTGQAAHSHQVA